MEVGGTHLERPKNKPFFAVKNFSRGGFFLVTLFLAEEEKVTGSKGFETKPSRMKARSVLCFYETCGVRFVESTSVKWWSPKTCWFGSSKKMDCYFLSIIQVLA